MNEAMIWIGMAYVTGSTVMPLSTINFPKINPSQTKASATPAAMQKKTSSASSNRVAPAM